MIKEIKILKMIINYKLFKIIFECLQTICRTPLSSLTPQDNAKLHATLDRVYQEVEKLKSK